MNSPGKPVPEKGGQAISNGMSSQDYGITSIVKDITVLVKYFSMLCSIDMTVKLCYVTNGVRRKEAYMVRTFVLNHVWHFPSAGER